MNIMNRILNYLRSIQWNHPGTGSFIFWLFHIILIVLALVLMAAVAIRDWLFF